MNVEISVFLTFDGDKTVAESLITDIANILIDHGYANDPDPDANLISLILMKQLEEFDVDAQLASSFYAVVPTKGEEDGSEDGNS